MKEAVLGGANMCGGTLLRVKMEEPPGRWRTQEAVLGGVKMFWGNYH